MKTHALIKSLGVAFLATASLALAQQTTSFVEPFAWGSIVQSGNSYIQSNEILASHANRPDAYRPPSVGYIGFKLPLMDGAFGAARLTMSFDQLGLEQAASLRVTLRDVGSSKSDILSPTPSQHVFDDLSSGEDYNSIYPVYINAADFGRSLTFELWHLPNQGQSASGMELFFGVSVEPHYFSSGYNPELPDNDFARFIRPRLEVWDVPFPSGVPEPSTYGLLAAATIALAIANRRWSIARRKMALS